jgi:hypothetical protein
MKEHKSDSETCCVIIEVRSVRTGRLLTRNRVSQDGRSEDLFHRPDMEVEIEIDAES